MDYLVNGSLSAELAAEIENNERTLKELGERQKVIREGLLDAMRKAGVVKIDAGNVKITYVAPSTQERFDSKELKADLPDIYNTYCKISNKKDYITIEVK